MKLMHARTTTAAALLGVALIAGACGGDREADDLEMQPMDSAAMGAGATGAAVARDTAGGSGFPFQPVGNATLAGEVEVEEEGSGTKVKVEIRNSTDGAVHKGHIHTGTCASPGSVVAPLNDVRVGGNGEGESETTVQVPMMTVMNGQHIVVYHVAGGNPGAPALCVAIPAH